MKKVVLIVSFILSLSLCGFTMSTDIQAVQKAQMSDRYVCKRCNGSGVEPQEFACSKCNGRGETSSIMNCPRCNGVGTVKDRYGDDQRCPECDGAKKILRKSTCHKCYGSGTEKRACWSCKGSGYVEK